jgi:hypothetical protein
MTDDVANLFDKRLCGAELREDFPCDGRAFLMLELGRGALVLPFSFLDADVVEICSGEYHRRVGLFLRREPFRISGHFGCVADALEIRLEIELHLNSDTVFEKIFFLLDQFRRQFPKALFSEFAVRRAAEVHLGVEHFVAAVFAGSPRFVLEEFDYVTAVGALCVKYRIKFPISWILSGTFHFRGPLSLPPCRLW